MERGKIEAAYDERVGPLVDQLIAACKADGVAATLSFSLDGDLQRTIVVTADGEWFITDTFDDEGDSRQLN